MTDKQYQRRLEELEQLQTKLEEAAEKLLLPAKCEALYMSNNDFNQWINNDNKKARKYSRNIKEIATEKNVNLNRMELYIWYVFPDKGRAYHNASTFRNRQNFTVETPREYNEYIYHEYKNLIAKTIQEIRVDVMGIYLQVPPDKLLLPSQNQTPLTDILFKPRR